MSVCEVKYGNQPDGSLLLGPESAKALNKAMARVRNDGLMWGPTLFTHAILAFKDVALKECSVEWEEYT